MLTCVRLVLRHNAALEGLEQSTRYISSFLGLSRDLSLSEACEFGSTELLDWIWASSCDAAGSAQWSLHKLLRSEPHYYRWQFAKSLEVAAGRGDAEVVKWLLEHFVGCEAPSSVVDAAAKNGHLGVLQFLLPLRARGREEDTKQEAVREDPGVISQDASKLSRQSSNEGGNVVYWGNEVMLRAAENGHTGVMRWLYENEVHEVEEEQRVRLVEHALRVSDFELADVLLPADGSTCVLDYDRMSPGLELIEWMLDLGYLRNEHVAASAIRDLAKIGHLELMKQILLLHSPPTADDKAWVDDWCDALTNACTRGDLPMTKWLVEHPKGREACGRITSEHKLINALLLKAAEGGQLEVLQYLYMQGANDRFGGALINAVREGHLSTVKCLLDYFPCTGRQNLLMSILEAVKYGRLEMLQLLHGMDTSGPTTSLRPKRTFSAAFEEFQPKPTCAWHAAASNGQLGALKWLFHNRKVQRVNGIVDDAVSSGDLEVLQWLYANGFDNATKKTIDRAARIGSLEMVQWLHVNRPEDCTTKAMDFAAEQGSLAVIKWLYAHRSEGCTEAAIKNALSCGHLRVAHWLHVHFPDHTPESIRLTCTSNFFELLLFLHAHYANILTHEFVASMKRSWFKNWGQADPFYHALKWLDEKYPAPDQHLQGTRA